MQSPIFEEVGKEKNTGKIIPLYPLTNGITQNVIRSIIENAMSEVDGKFLESIPSWVLGKYKLCDINYAMKNIHFPSIVDDFEKARKRIAFEELLTLQVALLLMKHNTKTENKGISFEIDEKINDLLSTLPYTLTNAQLRVWKEIDNDMPELSLEEKNEVEINIPEITTEDIEEQIKKWEEEFNKWYETDGKQYEEQLKNELSSFYQELVNQVKPNN